MRVRKHGRRGAPRANFLEDFAVSPLRKSTAAVFLRRGHSKNADAGKPVDQISRNIRCPINRHRIQILIEEFANLRERGLKLRLLRRRDARVGHRPIRHEASQKESLGKSQRLRPGKEQLFRFFDFFLPLDVCFVHKLGLLLR